MVPALAFANAPRMHNGGWAGLRPDEVPAILQRGERVLSRREAAGFGQSGASTVNVTINARDAESFRQSRTPDELQARTNTTMRSINRGVVVIVAPIAGILADAFGIRSMLVVAAVIFALVAAGLAATSFRNVRAPI